MSEKVPSRPWISDSVDAFLYVHVMAWRKLESFHLAAECFIPSGEFGFNWFPSAPGETTGRVCEVDKELPVVQGNSASPNNWAMVKQNCLGKHRMLLRFQQSPPSSQRFFFLFILWSTSPSALPPFIYPCLQAQPAAWIQIRTLVVLMIKRERNYKGLVILSTDH